MDQNPLKGHLVLWDLYWDLLHKMVQDRDCQAGLLHKTVQDKLQVGFIMVCQRAYGL